MKWRVRRARWLPPRVDPTKGFKPITPPRPPPPSPVMPPSALKPLVGFDCHDVPTDGACASAAVAKAFGIPWDRVREICGLPDLATLKEQYVANRGDVDHFDACHLAGLVCDRLERPKQFFPQAIPIDVLPKRTVVLRDLVKDRSTRQAIKAKGCTLLFLWSKRHWSFATLNVSPPQAVVQRYLDLAKADKFIGVTRREGTLFRHKVWTEKMRDCTEFVFKGQTFYVETSSARVMNCRPASSLTMLGREEDVRSANELPLRKA